MKVTVEPGRRVRGEATVPGDKSITHRAVLIGAICDGVSRACGYLPAQDCLASIRAVRQLGVTVEERGAEVVVHGLGLHGVAEPEDVIDCGGSGTTIRLLCGILAGQVGKAAFLTGNEALRRRPMRRILEPLQEMGAAVIGRNSDQLPPVAIRGAALRGLRYTLPVASAQVKSALLLAGLLASEPSEISEPARTRDHTERMLAAMGAPLRTENRTVLVQPAARLEPIDLHIPGDFSSAAFLLAAAWLVPGSELLLRNIGVNPTRTGLLEIARRMGAGFRVEEERLVCQEEVASLVAWSQPLRGTLVNGELVPLSIDELPLVAVLGTQAEGETVVRDAAELRVKESDRIAAIATELRKLGAAIDELPDGFAVRGPTALRGGTVNSHHDHRLAMALAVAGLVAQGPVTIEAAECVADSFPGFFALLEGLRC